MTKKSNNSFPSGIISNDAERLVLEINDLVRVRTALSYGTATSLKQSAESAISRKINSKVLQLSQIVKEHYDE